MRSVRTRSQRTRWIRRLVSLTWLASAATLVPFIPFVPSTMAQQAPTDFKVDLLYGVPEIEHPSAVTCDAEGNLFVGEDPMDMRGPSTEPIDRIILIRWNRDGGLPTKTVYCENLSAVFGMMWYRDALYVMNAPNYTRLRDTDGDGVADERVELANSLGHAPGLFGLNNHVPTGMRLGLDGFVYVALGDKGLPKAVGSDGSEITLEGGGVFRMRPDASQLEIVSHGIRNNMDVALDQFDNIFAFDNDDDYGWWMRVIHHVPTGYYGYPYDYRSRGRPFLPPVGEFGSGTACGGACYLEAAWPAKYQGSAFFCDLGESKIERYRLTRKGATFEAEIDDFIVGNSTDDFRPIDLCFSPDGTRMYIADWNESVGGKADRVGRLFRVTYVGGDVPPEPPRTRDADSIESQIRSLDHPSHSERMRAQQRLATLGQEAFEPLSQLVKGDEPTRVRVHAIWAQNGLIDELEDYAPTADWIAALGDHDAEVRGQAARALGCRRVKRAVADLARVLKDPDAHVRMQAAIALGRIGEPSSADGLFEALGEQDEVARFTMIEALRAIGDWSSALPRLRTESREVRERIVQAMEGVFDPVAVQQLRQWRYEAAEPLERAAALGAMAKAHRKAAPYTGGWWGGKAAGGKPARSQDIEWESTSVIFESIVAGLDDDLPQVRHAALELVRELPAAEQLARVRRIVDEDPDQNVRVRAIRLLTEWRDSGSVASLLRIAADSGSDQGLRAEAIRAIAAIDPRSHTRQIASIALADDSPTALVAVALDLLAAERDEGARQAIEKRLGDPQPALRAKAIDACAKLGDDNMALRLIPVLDDVDPSVQRAAIGALTTVFAGAKADIRAKVIKSLSESPDPRALPIYLDGLCDTGEQARTDSRAALLALGASIHGDIRTLHDRNELTDAARQELTKLFAPNHQFAFLRDGPPANREPTAYSKYAMEHPGDPERGRTLFENTKGIGCAKCHVVGGAGVADIGPNLLGIGAKYPRHELIRSVLEPSSRILIDFEMVVITTTGGLIHQGMVRSQTPEGIELVTSDGAVVSVPTDEIEHRGTSNLSPMPNGLANGMTLDNFADIIAYLESLKSP